jgi:hypothetical protein
MSQFMAELNKPKYAIEWIDENSIDTQCRNQAEVCARINEKANAYVCSRQTCITAIKSTVRTPAFKRSLCAMRVKNILDLRTSPAKQQ